MIEALVTVSLITISLLLMFMDIGFIILAQLNIHGLDSFDRNIMWFSIFLSVLKFFSFLVIVPAIALLVRADFETDRAIIVASSTFSVYKIYEESPEALAIIIVSNIIYFGCSILNFILLGYLDKRLKALNLDVARSYLASIKSIDNISFIFYIMINIILILIGLVKKGKKSGKKLVDVKEV